MGNPLYLGGVKFTQPQALFLLSCASPRRKAGIPGTQQKVADYLVVNRYIKKIEQYGEIYYTPTDEGHRIINEEKP